MSNTKKGDASNRFQMGNNVAEKELNWELLENLIGIFCTLEECAACLDLDESTINSKIKEKYGIPFSVYFKQKNAKGRASLRRRQFEMSKTNPALCIWLGKQYLGQIDSPLIDQSQHTTLQIIINKTYKGVEHSSDDKIRSDREANLSV